MQTEAVYWKRKLRRFPRKGSTTVTSFSAAAVSHVHQFGHAACWKLCKKCFFMQTVVGSSEMSWLRYWVKVMLQTEPSERFVAHKSSLRATEISVQVKVCLTSSQDVSCCNYLCYLFSFTLLKLKDKTMHYSSSLCNNSLWMQIHSVCPLFSLHLSHWL